VGTNARAAAASPSASSRQCWPEVAMANAVRARGDGVMPLLLELVQPPLVARRAEQALLWLVVAAAASGEGASTGRDLRQGRKGASNIRTSHCTTERNAQTISHRMMFAFQAHATVGEAPYPEAADFKLATYLGDMLLCRPPDKAVSPPSAAPRTWHSRICNARGVG
jgi:hypothetical protein